MHHHLIKPGVLELYYGAMKSGKTHSLIHRVEQLSYLDNIHFVIVQPAVNTRERGLKSRFSSRKLPTLIIDETRPEDILLSVTDKTVLVAIDEVNVFSDEIISVIENLQKQGINVVVAGLNTDYRGEPFGCMAKLMPIVDEPYALAGVCDYPSCNKPGTRTQRLVNGKPASRRDATVLIEGSQDEITYETRCLEHHMLLD